MELEETIRQLEKMLRDAGLLPGLPVPPPEPRYLVCHEILAKGVPQDSDGPVDRSKGKGGTDPYVRLLLLDGGPSATKKESAFTSYLQNMENPVWDGERLQMRLTPGGDRPPKLRVEMWDKDMFTPDEMIASGTVELPEAQAEGTISMRLAGVNALHAWLCESAVASARGV